MSAEDKLILKGDNLPGVDMSIKNFELFSSLPATWTSVTKTIWKNKRKTYIGIKEFVGGGEVIQVGKLGILYRIIRVEKVEGTRRGKGGKICRIARADGNQTTNVDLDNISLGQKVKIMGRQSYIDALDHKWGRDYVEPCPVEVKTTLPCGPKDDCNCE